MSEKQYFTLVFEGNIREFKGNPFKTETIFGVPVGAGSGDCIEQAERLEYHLRKSLDLTEEALREQSREVARLRALLVREKTEGQHD